MTPLKDAASRVAQHLSARREWRPPTWLIYVGGVSILLILILLGALVLQRHKWAGLLRAAKERIVEQESKSHRAEHDGVARATSRAVGALQRQENDLKKKQADREKQHKNQQQQIKKLTPAQLLEEFRREGF